MRHFRKSRRPGNRKPTQAEQAYQDSARDLGCVVCLFRQEHGMQSKPQVGNTEIHHRTLGDLHGQVRIGQGAVVAMCEYHHRNVFVWGYGDDEMREEFGPSFAGSPRDFREWTADVLPGMGRGTEAWQAYQDGLLGLEDAA